MTLRPLVALAALAVLAGGCSTFDDLFGRSKPPALQGERKPILTADSSVEADASLANTAVTLPRPTANKDWPLAGGYADHAMHHLALGERPARLWQADVGAGSSSSRRLLAQPVVADGKVFVLNARGEARAFEAGTGRGLWTTRVTPKGDDDANLGGGVGYWRGKVFVASGGGEVLALDAGSGKELWRTAIGTPARSSPTVANGRVFVVNGENEIVALDAEKGERLWTATGVAEPTAILGGSSPAVEGNVLVAAQSSGEITAVRVENGRTLWQERLAAARQLSSVTNIADIVGRPVIDRGLVLGVSNAGRLAAVDIRSGRRVWDVDVGGLQSPWVAGEWVFALSNEGQLLAVARATGRVRWARNLNAYASDRDQKRGIVWSGPVLAGDRLIVAGSHGEALSISPYTGEPRGRLALNEGVLIAPVVADGTLYFLDESGRLLAMR